jgi:pimeloyl-ACP methyl ester carboxylesterase
MVSVDGIDLRVMTAGFEHLERNQPVVVLESGAGSPIHSWRFVFTRVARFAPVIAYERPGVGESEFDEAPRSMDRTADQLRALLTELGAPPPYVLVGHSLGGPFIRTFAGRFPDEVAGLVYVDPSDITQPVGTQLQALVEIGVDDPAAAYAEVRQMQRDLAARSSEGVQADYELFIQLMATEPEDRGFLPAPSVPTVVIAAPKPDQVPPGLELSFDVQALQRATNRARIQSWSDWMQDEPEGLLIVASHASHSFVVRDAPDIVVDAIERVVFPDIGLQLRAAAEEGDAEVIIAAYHPLKHRYPPDRFDEDLLTLFAWELFDADRIEDALAVMELNVEEYPHAAHPWYSLGYAYGETGRLDEAVRSYERAVELAERRGHPLLATYRSRLEGAAEQMENP